MLVYEARRPLGAQCAQAVRGARLYPPSPYSPGETQMLSPRPSLTSS
jgi:hypothetical protein